MNPLPLAEADSGSMYLITLRTVGGPLLSLRIMIEEVGHDAHLCYDLGMYIMVLCIQRNAIRESSW